jgi:crossover junction endodeoxyribonuclease RusA
VKTYSFNLPYPPSQNHIWRNGQKRTYLTAKAKIWHHHAKKALEALKLTNEGIDAPVRVTLILQAPDKRKRDVHNLHKIVLDALTECNFWTDDSLVEDCRQIWAHRWDKSLPKVVKGGSCLVKVEVYE